MTTQLYPYGGTAVIVRDPSASFRRAFRRVGASERAVDGTLRLHLVAVKYQWEVSWALLTDAERSVLETQLAYGGQMVWIPPDGATSYTVIVVDWDWSPDLVGHAIRATLEQV